MGTVMHWFKWTELNKQINRYEWVCRKVKESTCNEFLATFIFKRVWEGVWNGNWDLSSIALGRWNLSHWVWKHRQKNGRRRSSSTEFYSRQNVCSSPVPNQLLISQSGCKNAEMSKNSQRSLNETNTLSFSGFLWKRFSSPGIMRMCKLKYLGNQTGLVVTV